MMLVGAFMPVAVALQAQPISGVVVRESTGTPVAGAVVLLLGAARDTTLARGTTTAGGRFQLGAPAPGAYRIRVLRLGQRPFTTAVLRIEAARTNERVVLPEQPLQLVRFDVTGSSRGCLRDPAAGTAVGQLLAEARTAFLASVSVSPDGAPRATYRKFRWAENRSGDRLVAEQSAVAVLASSRPFVSLPADSLARTGYVMVEPDSVAYHAPDADVLLSESFAKTHCFLVVQGDSSHAGALGIEFRPVTRRDNRRDITGVIWMRPASTVVHEVRYQYDPPTAEDRVGRIGGRVTFDTTSSGIWFVRHWEIRMPVVSAVARTDLMRSLNPMQIIRRLEQVQVSGGAVMDVRLGAALQFVDSVEIERATRVSRLQAEAQRVEREANARLADVGFIGDLCGELRAPDRGAVTGQVLSPSGAPMANVPVRASWRVAQAIGTDRLGYRDDTAEALTMATGRFVLCPIPTEIPVRVAVVADRRELGMKTAVITAPEFFARVPLSVALSQMATVAAASRVDPFQRADQLADAVAASASRPSDRAHAEVDKRIERGVPNAALRRADLLRDRFSLISDAMRSLQGIEIVAAGGGAQAVSRRASGRAATAGSGCTLRVLVDGVLRPEGTSVDVAPPSDIHAVEVYVGSSRIPPQFGGFRDELACGLVAVWTVSR
ncbi:MAG TPA: carboxypeptidase-like regulatory domain-containing protein [Gemmatimonas sp.]|uniref:carboxypeptidase-like regulatory domain-containing protein n=1 Tax=Gemmatimonas sp. TaxID=1962908 RepID=UPI002ED89FF0